MINCIYINENENEFKLFETIINEKNKPGKDYLLSIKEKVEVCYDLYLNEFDSLEQKPHSDFHNQNNEIDSLILCYTSETKTFQMLRGKIFDNQSRQLKALCPYCLLNKPKTLDHYISKTQFPEYSILVKNLIPCCYDCNQKKGEIWRLNSRRRLIHFYNDNFLFHRFLYADLVFNDNIDVPDIIFFLAKPDEMSIENFEIVSWHFEDLELINEYTDRANAFISSEINIIKQSIQRGDSIINVNQSIIDKINNTTFGENYWEKCMYEALSNRLNEIINI